MAVLYSPTRVRIRAVRNLGWLVRNWKTVQSFRVVPTPGKSAECILIARMDPKNTPGGVAEYRTDFACARLLWDWLHRSIFAGLPVFWGADDTPDGFVGHCRIITIGKPNNPRRTYSPLPVADSHYRPIRSERAPGYYADWCAYRDAVGATTEREESTARVRWDEWCKLCARARGD